MDCFQIRCAAVEVALNSMSDGVYVNSEGGLITPALAFCSAVEHLQRWSSVLGRHGLLLLEVHLLDVGSTLEHIQSATSLHFDALQAWTGQMLLPAMHWAAAAAAAGLSSPKSELLQYPKDSKYTRITLQRLTPSELRIQLACADDLPALRCLEQFQPSGLQADDEILLRRIAQYPSGQFVAVKGATGELIGAIYTQRLVEEAALLSCTVGSELELHTSRGRIVQLLGLVAKPDASAGLQGVGDALRNFVITQASLDCGVSCVYGVTRCREFELAGKLSYEEHVRSGNDCGLQFHLGGGATLVQVVWGYRPADAANVTNGVLIRYETSVCGLSHEHAPESKRMVAVLPTLIGMGSHRALPTLSECGAHVRASLDELHFRGGNAGEWAAESMRLRN